MLDDKALDAIHYKRSEETVTLADVDALLRHIQWLEQQWIDTDDALRACLDQTDIDEMHLRGFYIYKARDRGVGVWRTDKNGNKIP